MEWLSVLKTCVDWAMKLFGYVKEDKGAKHAELIKQCARKIRAFADRQRKEQRNELWCIPRDRIFLELGEHAALTDEVIEFMEEKGWATKANYPPECWRIN